MSAFKKKFLKIPLLGLCLLAPLAAWLGFGKQGLVHLYKTEMDRQACVERIRLLAEENQSLLEEIHRLRTDMKYIESLARKEFNLIKENEMVYRFKEEKRRTTIPEPAPAGASKGDGVDKPERTPQDDQTTR